MSGGIQLRVMELDVVASTTKFSGGMLGAAVRNYKGEYFMTKYKQETRKVYTVEPLLKDTPEVRVPG